MLLLIASAGLIAVNWLVYIWAIQHRQVFQASLGYYINPLVFVAVGMLFFGERLSLLQKLAVALAAIGVAVLAISGGRFPLLAMTLAVSFTIYSVIRRQVPVAAMPALFVETLVLLPAALLWLGVLARQDTSVFMHSDIGMQLLIAAAGPATVVPLLCFGIAARRLPLATIGFMQFIAPSLQFLIGYLSGERLTMPHLICFAFIWMAVIAFSADVLHKGRRRVTVASGQ
jgi:chloramphenicol-sensitive protein RarD